MQGTPSDTPELRLEREGDIGFVVASNPARMNAFTAGMWKAVPEVLAAAEADPEIRVIVLRGAGAGATQHDHPDLGEIGRASCRERV